MRKEMLAERSVWPINQPDPDGRFALHLARQEESTARTEYMRVLKIFMKLILHGTPPGEEPVSDSFSLTPATTNGNSSRLPIG